MRTIAVLMVFACWGANGQSVDAQPAFEVASVKPSAPPDGMRMGMRVMVNGGPGTRDPGRFTATNFGLSGLVTMAYDIKQFQLIAPAWLNDQRFDVAAKIPEGATKEQFRQMLQNLLAERFKLAVHRDTKEMPMYELVVAKNGPKMKESVEDAQPKDDAGPPAPPPGPMPKITLDKDGYPVLPPGRPGMMIVMNGRARLQASKESMEQLANRLANQLGKPVTDATGLKGKYDFTLSWAFEGMRGMGPGGPMPPPGSPEGGAVPLASAPEGDSGPTIFGALQAQLGLKLDLKKGPVEMLVIDHIEKVPTEN